MVIVGCHGTFTEMFTSEIYKHSENTSETESQGIKGQKSF